MMSRGCARGLELLRGRLSTILANGSGPMIAIARNLPRLLIELRAGRVGTSSFALAHCMRLESDPEVVFAQGEAVMVWIDIASGKSRPLPQSFRALLQP